VRGLVMLCRSEGWGKDDGWVGRECQAGCFGFVCCGVVLVEYSEGGKALLSGIRGDW